MSTLPFGAVSEDGVIAPHSAAAFFVDIMLRLFHGNYPDHFPLFFAELSLY